MANELQEIECKGNCGNIIVPTDNTTPCMNHKDGYCCICRFAKPSRRYCEFCRMVWNESMAELAEEKYDNLYGYGAYREKQIERFAFKLLGKEQSNTVEQSKSLLRR